MSKRTPGLPRRPREYWATPFVAVRPIVPFVPPSARWIEPCAGDGAIVRHMARLMPSAPCVGAYDIEPQSAEVRRADALTLEMRPDLYITNPPWPRAGSGGEPVLGLIKHLAVLAPTWMLLPWDFAANIYFGEVSRISQIAIPIGRVSWMGNGSGGKDNAGWFLFDGRAIGDGPRMIARSRSK